MADLGLIGGLAEGLKQGFSSYRDAKKDAEELAMKKRMLKLQEYGEGAKISDTLGYVPEGLLSEDVASSFKDQKTGMGSKAKKEAEALLDDRLKAMQSGQDVILDPETGMKKIVPLQEGQMSPKMQEDRKKEKKQGLLQDYQLMKDQLDVRDKMKKDTPQGRLESMSGDVKMKAGAIFSMEDSIGELENLVSQGKKPGYVTQDSSVLGVPVGKLVQDNPIDVVSRKLVDDIGRLRSGGAIGREEESRFKNMLPTPGDNKEAALFKLGQIRKEMAVKKSALGVERPGGLLNINDDKPKAPSLSAADQAALEWASKNPNNPDAAAIKKSLGIK